MKQIYILVLAIALITYGCLSASTKDANPQDSYPSDISKMVQDCKSLPETNPHPCSYIDPKCDKHPREDCLKLLASINQKIPGLCTELSGYNTLKNLRTRPDPLSMNSTDACLINDAFVIGDKSLCPNDPLARGYCFSQFDYHNISNCQGLNDVTAQQECIGEDAIFEQDFSYCKLITDSRLKDYCYYEIVGKFARVGKCVIFSGDAADYCYGDSVREKNGTNTACENISDRGLLKECYSYLTCKSCPGYSSNYSGYPYSFPKSSCPDSCGYSYCESLGTGIAARCLSILGLKNSTGGIASQGQQPSVDPFRANLSQTILPNGTRIPLNLSTSAKVNYSEILDRDSSGINVVFYPPLPVCIEDSCYRQEGKFTFYIGDDYQSAAQRVIIQMPDGPWVIANLWKNNTDEELKLGKERDYYPEFYSAPCENQSFMAGGIEWMMADMESHGNSDDMLLFKKSDYDQYGKTGNLTKAYTLRSLDMNGEYVHVWRAIPGYVFCDKFGVLSVLSEIEDLPNPINNVTLAWDMNQTNNPELKSIFIPRSSPLFEKLTDG